MLYSMHDFQIANLLRSLSPSYNFTYIEYAANIVIEVRQSREVNEQGIYPVFVKAVYNGKALPIETCA